MICRNVRPSRSSEWSTNWMLDSQERRELEREGRADHIATISVRGERVGSVNAFRFTNDGPATAHNVMVKIVGAVRVSLPAGAATLEPGEEIAAEVRTAWQSDWPLLATIRWIDGRGPQERVAQLHRPVRGSSTARAAIPGGPTERLSESGVERR